MTDEIGSYQQGQSRAFEDAQGWTRQEFCPKTRDRPHDYAHYPVGTDGRRVDQMQPNKEYAAGMFCRHCGKPK